MAINGYEDKFQLADFIESNLSKAHPIDDRELLFGRDSDLGKVEMGLLSRGTQVFVIGDRGVGKSSVAKIAASLYQSADSSPIHINCGPQTTFEGIVASMVYEVLNVSKVFAESRVENDSFFISVAKVLNMGVSVTKHLSLSDIEGSIRDVTDAVRIIKWIEKNHSERPVVLIDEFDRIEDLNERRKFADLLKHIGDQGIKVKLIVTGISENVTELIGAHPSATRQIEAISIPRLNFEYRWQIITHPLNLLGIEISTDLLIRIALISDGYPYYVHLLTEKLIWVLFRQSEIIDQVAEVHFHEALSDAIESCSPEYSEPYKQAVIRKDDEVETVLWSTADTEYLTRDLEEMYGSYLHIQKNRKKQPMPLKEYSKVVKSFTKKSAVEILRRYKPRSPYFVYRENMLRGYVRLQAESHGVVLYDEAKIPKESTAKHASARVGYQTSSVPEGVEFSRANTKKRKGMVWDIGRSNK